MEKGRGLCDGGGDDLVIESSGRLAEVVALPGTGPWKWKWSSPPVCRGKLMVFRTRGHGLHARNHHGAVPGSGSSG